MKAVRIEDALTALAAGRPVIVVDDEGRENEGDLIAAAAFVTADTIAFMVRYTSGVLCVGLPAERTCQLGLPLMVADNSDTMRTAFTVSVDLKEGCTTGISASERAATVRALVDPVRVASDFSRPGHIFPLRAVEGGVLRRPGHTEASVDLTRLAGLSPGGVLAEIVNDDGTMARRGRLGEFAREHGLCIVTIHDLVAYRRKSEKFVYRESTARMPTKWGVFTAHSYRDSITGMEHLALTMGEPAKTDSPLVRVHSECLTGEVFGSLRCDCKPQLDLALERIAAAGCGVAIYLRGHEGRGIGITHKLRAYALQDGGADTADANLALGLPVDGRDYSTGCQMLADLGVRRMRLMTNNPRKYEEISAHGLVIVERIPLVIAAQRENEQYLRTKRERMGHLMHP